MIQEHIHKLLFEHDCVIIPDFGGLITHYEPARIHPAKHTFLPPSKRIAFNEKLKVNDGLLITTFAYDKHIAPEAAQMRIAEFVCQMQEELTISRRYELKGIGIFRLNSEQKIEFDYILSDNFLSDSFGLPEFIARPIVAPDAASSLRTLLKEKQGEEAVSTAKPTLRRKVRRLYDTAAVMAITGLSIGVLYLLSLQTDYALSTLSPFSTLPSTVLDKNILAETKTKIVKADNISTTEKSGVTKIAGNQPVIAEVSEPETTPVPTTTNSDINPEAIVDKNNSGKHESLPATITSKKETTEENNISGSTNKENIPIINKATARYYVIAGGYSSLRNAEWSRKHIFGNGKDSKVIVPFAGSKLHRVSIADFTTKEQAIAKLPDLRKKFGKYIWILNY